MYMYVLYVNVCTCMYMYMYMYCIRAIHVTKYYINFNVDLVVQNYLKYVPMYVYIHQTL